MVIPKFMKKNMMKDGMMKDGVIKDVDLDTPGELVEEGMKAYRKLDPKR